MEVLGHPGEGLDISLGPFPSRFEDYCTPFAVHQDGIAVEAKLLWKSYGLAPAGPENTCRLSLYHDTYQ